MMRILSQIESDVAASAASDAGDSPFFLALEEVGFVGCNETDEQLSTTYKSQLDFSTRGGLGESARFRQPAA
jgi:hypothetical protein